MTQDIQKIRLDNLSNIVSTFDTQAAFAKRHQLNPTYISQLMRKKRPIGEKSARKIESAIGVKSGYLDIERTTDNKDTIEHNSSLAGIENPDYNVSNISYSDTRKIPMVSWVKAGSFSEAIDLHEPGFADEFVPVSGLKCSKSTIALRVDGDSMEPEFPDGVTIIVDPEREAMPGDYVVARHNGDNEATFKRFVKDGAGYSLMPLNKMYDKLAVTEETQIVGVVIEQLSRKSY